MLSAATRDPREYRLAALVFTEVTRSFDQFVDHILGAVRLRDGEHPRGAARPTVENTTERILRALVEDAELSRDDDERLERTGTTMARAGIDLITLIRATHAGMTAGFTIVMSALQSVAREHAVPADVMLGFVDHLVQRQSRLHGDLVAALTRGHVGDADRRVTPQVAVDKLVAGDWRGTDDVRRLARKAHIDTAARYALVVFAAPTSGVGRDAVAASTAGEGASALVASCGGATGSQHPAPPPAHAVAVVKAASATSVAHCATVAHDIARTRKLRALMYDPATTLSGLSADYRRARHDLEAVNTLQLDPGLLTARELAFYRVCTGSSLEDRLDFVERTCGELLRHPRGEVLIETLEAFYTTGHTDRGLAECMQIHTNTVKNRFRTVTEVTSLDASVPAELHQLILAVRLRRVLIERSL